MKKITNTLISCTLIACIVITAGCRQGQFKEVKQICIPQAQQTDVAQTAEEVLGKMGFRIAKSDAQAGIITTYPLAAGQSFEFWRKDISSSKDQFEADLHSIRSTIQIYLRRENKQICVTCNVKAERLNLPGREINSSSDMYGMFTKSSSSVQKLKLNPAQKQRMLWVDMGRDAKLETRILKQIQQLKGK